MTGELHATLALAAAIAASNGERDDHPDVPILVDAGRHLVVAVPPSRGLEHPA